MRKTLSILILLILIPSVHALDTLYSGSVTSGESVKAGDTTYTIIKGEEARILAQAADHALFIQNNSCEDGPLTRVCATHMEYDTDERADIITLTIESLEPSLTITRTIDDSEFEAGNGATIHVEITNNGGLARQLTYQETFPAGFEVVDIEGNGRKTESGFEWTKTSLAEDESAEFDITVKVDVVTEQKLSATLTHVVNGKVNTIYTDAIDIVTTPRVVSEMTIGKDEVVIGEPNNITITYTNKEPTTAHANVILELDPGLRITKAPPQFSRISERRYEAALTFTKTNATRNKSVEYTFQFVADEAGTYHITSRGAYEAETKNDLSTLREEIESSDKGVILRTNVDDETFESGEEVSMRLWLQNLNPYVEITDVTMQVRTANFTTLPAVFIPTLGKQEHYKTHDKTFYAPLVTTTTGYTITGDVNYSVNSKQFADSFDFTVNVVPVQPLTISHTHPSSAESGDDIPVTITITNPRVHDIQKARLRITVPADFTPNGDTDITLPLSTRSDTVHAITLTAPRTASEKTYTINSSVSYYNEDAEGEYLTNEHFAYNHSSTFTLNPESFELSISRSADDTNVVVGDEILVTTTIQNSHGTLIAQNIEVTPQLAQGTEVINNPPPIKNLLPGESHTFTMRYRVVDDETQTLPPLSLHYQNQHGETHSANSSTLAVTGESGATRAGPLVRATRNIPRNGSILHPVEVSVELFNNGSADARVTLTDEEEHTVPLRAGERRTITYEKQFTHSGVYTLSPAEISYEYNGNTYHGATNENTIIIKNAELLSATRTVLSADTLRGVSLELNITPFAEISNIMLRDGTHSEKLTNSTRYTLPYISQNLPGATITFTYHGKQYQIYTENQTLTVQETLPITATKDGMLITITNNAHDEIAITLGNATVTIAPSETKHIESSEQRLTYTYQDEQRTIVLGNENIIKPTSPESFLETIIGILQAIATWRR